MYQQGWSNDQLGLAVGDRLDDVPDHRWSLVAVNAADRPLPPPTEEPTDDRSRPRRPPSRRRRADGAPRRRGTGGRARTAGPVTYVLLAVVALVSVFPLYCTVVDGLAHQRRDGRGAAAAAARRATCSTTSQTALEQAPIGTALLNSLIVSGAITVGTVLFCTLAGFAFAKLRFRGRNAAAGAGASRTMMVPPQLGVIPLYMMMAELRLAGPPAGGRSCPTLVTRVRRVLHAAVPASRRCPTS